MIWSEFRASGRAADCQAYSLNLARAHGDTVLIQNSSRTDDISSDGCAAMRYRSK